MSDVMIRDASLDEAVAVFLDSFADYPVMRHVLADSGRYADDFRAAVELFVRNRALRGHPMLALTERDVVVGCATLTPMGEVALDSLPGAAPSAEIEAVNRETWRRLGAAAERRYEEFAAAANAVDAGRPNIHVNMLGVVGEAQGRGHARRLLEAVHDLSLRTPGSEGVSLTTENPANVPFYEHLGYGVVAQAPFGDGRTTWGFFRPDAG